MNWRDALCVAEFSDVHMFVYVNVVGETDDKLSTADMDNKNINSLLNGETKDESQIDYVNDKPLTEEKDCESPAAESDDKSSTGYTDDKLSTQSDEPPSEKEEEQPLHAGWLTKYGWLSSNMYPTEYIVAIPMN